MSSPRQYAEERHARALHKRLKVFATTSSEITVSIEGDGLHWHCTASLPPFSSTINCFDDDGPEFLVSFNVDSTLATGRTNSQDEAVAAVRAWLEGRPLQEMYSEFDFIDQTRRSLSTLIARATELYPEISEVSRDLERTWSDQHELSFSAQERSCRLYYYGDNTFPSAVFRWDSCELFTVETGDVDSLALLLKRWLCDRAMPSVLQQEFPWLQMSSVAEAYEQGRGIEGEFLASWDSITSFFDGSRHSHTENILGFIARIRESGFDRTLRAGQSMYTMMVSRSRRHGLRGEQSWIAFDFRAGGIEINSQIGGESERLTTSDYDFTPEIMAQLERLEETQID